MTPSERAALVAQIAVGMASDPPDPEYRRRPTERPRDHAHRLCTLAALWLEEAAAVVGVERIPARPDYCESCGGVEDDAQAA